MALRYLKIKKSLILAAVLVAFIVLLVILKNSKYIAEYFFARGISRSYIYIVGTITSLFPFSIFEFFILITAIIIIVLIVKAIRMLRRRCYHLVAKNFLVIVNIVLSITLLYSMTASMSYNRFPVENYLPQYNEIPDNDYIEDMAKYYINEYNKLSLLMPRDSKGNIVNPYSIDDLGRLIASEYKKLTNGYFSQFTPKVKSLISSPVWSAFSIIGVSFQPTAEANVNYNDFSIYLPHTMAHEIAHSKGVMWESDAELVADYITLTSDNDYIRYSGLTSSLTNILNMVIYSNNDTLFDEIYGSIGEECWRDIKYANEIYKNFGSLKKIGRFVNDLYLKASGAPDGVVSYEPPSDIKEIEDPDDPSEIIYLVNSYSNAQKLLLALYNDCLV